MDERRDTRARVVRALSAVTILSILAALLYGVGIAIANFDRIGV